MDDVTAKTLVEITPAELEFYRERAEYFDTHDLSDDLASRPEVHFEISKPSSTTYYPLEPGLSRKLRKIARQRGVSAETLLNQWVQEKATEGPAAGEAEQGKC